MSHELRRRTFLKVLSSLASATAATGGTVAASPDASSRESEVKPGDPSQRPGGGKDVIVIGGGCSCSTRPSTEPSSMSTAFESAMRVVGEITG